MGNVTQPYSLAFNVNACMRRYIYTCRKAACRNQPAAEIVQKEPPPPPSIRLALYGAPPSGGEAVVTVSADQPLPACWTRTDTGCTSKPARVLSAPHGCLARRHTHCDLRRKNIPYLHFTLSPCVTVRMDSAGEDSKGSERIAAVSIDLSTTLNFETFRCAHFGEITCI